MIKHNQVGAINLLLVPFVLAILLLIAAIAFGGWAFSSRQDFKNNTEQKIAAAVVVAKEQESTTKDTQFAEAEKSPLQSYSGPQAFGSINVAFPKTWSAYVDDSGNGSAAVDGYFNPGHVPSLTNQSSTFALRVQVLPTSYATTISSFSSVEQQGKLTAVPYTLPKVGSVVGVMLNGQISSQLTGVMVVLPLRSNTLEIYTEGSQYVNDFNNYVLPNFSFSP